MNINWVTISHNAMICEAWYKGKIFYRASITSIGEGKYPWVILVQKRDVDRIHVPIKVFNGSCPTREAAVNLSEECIYDDIVDLAQESYYAE